MSETNWKKGFCERYFDKGAWELEVLHEVDVLLNDRRGKALLYIETKEKIANETDRRKALAQTILTNRKQVEPLQQVALAYSDIEGQDTLELLDCSDNAVLYNNDINWEKERPSSPTRDAIDRICDRLHGRISVYHEEEIAELYSRLKKGQNAAIEITTRNFNMVYRGWKAAVHFKEKVEDEQDLINLFLVDMLNGAHYKKSVYHDIEDNTLFGKVKLGEREEDGDQDLIREGTNLSQYRIMYEGNEADGIKYMPKTSAPSLYYTIADRTAYSLFWRKYHRPPEKHQFLDILERSATLYSEKYRRTTGGEYTPSCFVEKQVELLNKHYCMDDYIVFDPCAGVGNLENQFGRDYKHYCYLSTLEQMDVDTCKIKGFENSMQYDYLKDTEHPGFKYKGQMLDINGIAHREGRKLMVIMNPPYQRRKGFTHDICIEFFLKVLKLRPDVIVLYCKTEFFLRDTVSVFVESGYNIVSHIFSNAHDTFRVSEWSVSLVVFDHKNGNAITPKYITTDRYDYNRHEDKLDYIRTYTYDNDRPNLIKEIEGKLKKDATGMRIGQWTNNNYCIVISNSNTHKQHITVNNIYYALLLKGINFNTHGKYFEVSDLTYRGTVKDIPAELANDAIMFSQFYKGILFSNRGQRNYIMPFTADELGCGKNDLNVLFPQDADLFSAVEGNIEPPFDFRVWFHQYDYSSEAKALYNAALAMFRYYHESPDYAAGRDWNDSFYDITNTIMGKDASQFAELDTDNDRRITRVKTTKGTRGFSRNNIKYAVPSDALPIFESFFDARDVLAKKINDQLVDAGLLLWKRENIY